MTDTTGPSSARSGMPHRADGPDFQANRHHASRAETGAVALVSAHVARERRQEPDLKSGEMDCLHRSFAHVTADNHPRTAKLLASSTRKTAQKVIEEAGEVAIEAVKHHPRGIVRESADLLYYLVALWHRTGTDPDDVWNEMRSRADTLGIAEKLPKDRGASHCRSARDVKRPTERNGS